MNEALGNGSAIIHMSFGHSDFLYGIHPYLQLVNSFVYFQGISPISKYEACRQVVDTSKKLSTDVTFYKIFNILHA